MLKCATSLWSADLANLAADIRRVEPYSERFQLAPFKRPTPFCIQKKAPDPSRRSVGQYRSA